MPRRLRCHVIFSGHVQGVGFRYTARRFADECGLVGWVKNLPDGTVEMMAEGEESALDDVLARITAYFGRYIRDVLLQKLPALGDYTAFDIIS